MNIFYGELYVAIHGLRAAYSNNTLLYVTFVLKFVDQYDILVMDI